MLFGPLKILWVLFVIWMFLFLSKGVKVALWVFLARTVFLHLHPSFPYDYPRQFTCNHLPPPLPPYDAHSKKRALSELLPQGGNTTARTTGNHLFQCRRLQLKVLTKQLKKSKFQSLQGAVLYHGANVVQVIHCGVFHLDSWQDLLSGCGIICFLLRCHDIVIQSTDSCAFYHTTRKEETNLLYCQIF